MLNLQSTKKRFVILIKLLQFVLKKKKRVQFAKATRKFIVYHGTLKQKVHFPYFFINPWDTSCISLDMGVLIMIYGINTYAHNFYKCSLRVSE